MGAIYPTVAPIPPIRHSCTPGRPARPRRAPYLSLPSGSRTGTTPRPEVRGIGAAFGPEDSPFDPSWRSPDGASFVEAPPPHVGPQVSNRRAGPLPGAAEASWAPVGFATVAPISANSAQGRGLLHPWAPGAAAARAGVRPLSQPQRGSSSSPWVTSGGGPGGLERLHRVPPETARRAFFRHSSNERKALGRGGRSSGPIPHAARRTGPRSPHRVRHRRVEGGQSLCEPLFARPRTAGGPPARSSASPHRAADRQDHRSRLRPGPVAPWASSRRCGWRSRGRGVELGLLAPMPGGPDRHTLYLPPEPAYWALSRRCGWRRRAPGCGRRRQLTLHSAHIESRTFNLHVLVVC